MAPAWARASSSRKPTWASSGIGMGHGRYRVVVEAGLLAEQRVAGPRARHDGWRGGWISARRSRRRWRRRACWWCAAAGRLRCRAARSGCRRNRDRGLRHSAGARRRSEYDCLRWSQFPGVVAISIWTLASTRRTCAIATPVRSETPSRSSASSTMAAHSRIVVGERRRRFEHGDVGAERRNVCASSRPVELAPMTMR